MTTHTKEGREGKKKKLIYILRLKSKEQGTSETNKGRTN